MSFRRSVSIIDITSYDPSEWPAPVEVNVTGLSGVYVPEDPEPEFVSISDDNIAVVTLQENNAIVLIDIENQSVIDSFTAGSVNLVNIDTQDDGQILPVESKSNVVREPDGVTWMGQDYFATANEGDMLGGSRGFTIFNKGELRHRSIIFVSLLSTLNMAWLFSLFASRLRWNC